MAGCCFFALASFAVPSESGGVSELGKVLFILGLVFAGIGLALWSGFGKGWFGRLPGDIHYTRGNFTFYFPLVTSILVSLVVTLIFWFWRK